MLSFDTNLSVVTSALPWPFQNCVSLIGTSQLLHSAKTTSHITPGKAGGLPAQDDSSHGLPSCFSMGWGLSRQGVCSCTGLVTPSSVILLSPSYGTPLLSCAGAAPLLLQGLGPHLSCSTAPKTAAPQPSSAAWSDPYGLFKIKVVLGVSSDRVREKGLDFCNFIHLSFGKYFFL